jgi:hypothetical protein
MFPLRCLVTLVSMKYRNDRRHGKKPIPVKMASAWSMDSIMVVEADVLVKRTIAGQRHGCNTSGD